MSKNKDLQSALDSINKQFGKGSVMSLSDNSIENLKRIKSGSIKVDQALGGGWPKGRIVEIYGAESSGKSSLTLHAIAECQKEGGICVIIDAEHAFDRFYAAKLGVDVDNLYLCQPDSGDQGLEIADMLVKSGGIDLLIIDSVAALTPKAELEGEMGDSKMGLQARLMSQAMRKMTASISKKDVCVVFINQVREKLGIIFGTNETTTGGNALKFYASIRVKVSRGSQLKNGDDVYGHIMKIDVKKNKTAPPFKKAEVNFLYGYGIDDFQELIDIAVEQGIIKKNGSWFSYGEIKLGQGADNVKTLLSDNLELMDEIKSKLTL